VAQPAKKRKAETLKQGREVELENPEPWPEAVNGAELLDVIAATFERYLILPEHASTALALWVIHCYTFSAWFMSPFLAITSATRRCGKTLLLILLGALVPRRLLASNVSAAVLFRTIEKYGPTLLIDEADTFVRDNDDLRGILNSGHTKTTAVVIRAVGDDHEPRLFSTWCPKAIALIGKLPGTLDDRSIEIGMRRRATGEHIEQLRQDRIDATCREFRQRAARWAADHVVALQDADPPVPSTLHDRAADCWRPLLAVADAAGGNWPERGRSAAVGLTGATTETTERAVELLQDIRHVWPDHEAFLATGELLKKLQALEDRPWGAFGKTGKPITGQAVAAMLKGFKIFPGHNEAGSVRGYQRNSFEDWWRRYPRQSSDRQNGNENGPELAISSRQREKPSDDSEMQKTLINMGVSDDLTIPEPQRVKIRL
jgi:hypothetical protein